MQRGSRSLFGELLVDEKPTLTVVRNSGRDSNLILKRDTKLVYRHYYYLKIQRLQYQDILKNLFNEFDLAERTIIERLQKDENNRLLKQLIKATPKVDHLRKLYPYLLWKESIHAN